MAAAKVKKTYTAAEVAALENTIQTQQGQIEAQQAQIEELKRKLDHMNEVFANAQRARFGQSSEKAAYVLGTGQMSLFNEAEKEQDHKAEEPTEETFTVKAHARKKKRTLEEMTAKLAEEEILLELPEDQRICGKCGGTFKPIGKKFVRHELQIIPRQAKLLAYYTVTYACDHCEKDTGFAHIANVKPPVPLMKHSLASPSSVADIMAKKYADGLPLARQEKIWAREGVELSRATMANWVIQCAQTWLKPLYKHMKQRLLEEEVIHADETVVQVLKEDGKPASSESRMWVYGSGERSATPIRLFEYQPDRSGKRAESFLRGFSKKLVTDGYAGYNAVANVTHFGCWTHMKRKWHEAMPKGATVQTSKAAVGYQYCNKLFALEKKCADFNNKLRKEYRQNFILPVLEEYFCWVNTLNPEQGSKLETAMKYAQNQRGPLSAFIDHPDVPISNNLAENAIRPFALGRKNWLFCDTTKGAEASAIVYSIVETTKANGIDPYNYLLYVLSVLPYYGKSLSHELLEAQMPWSNEVQSRYRNVAKIATE